jgi:hypothetical protein
VLVHPLEERGRLATYEPTRLLQDGLGILGCEFHDPLDKGRRWCVHQVFAPLESRMIGGVRAKVVDARGFISFVNQRDLEVLLGLGEPGDLCPWLGSSYVEPGDPEWFGLCVDDDDLADDLLLRELELRAVHHVLNGCSYKPVEGQPEQLISRRIHMDFNRDVEELLLLRWDYDPDTKQCPDTKLETVNNRWTRAERKAVRWQQLR